MKRTTPSRTVLIAAHSILLAALPWSAWAFGDESAPLPEVSVHPLTLAESAKPILALPKPDAALPASLVPARRGAMIPASPKAARAAAQLNVISAAVRAQAARGADPAAATRRASALMFDGGFAGGGSGGGSGGGGGNFGDGRDDGGLSKAYPRVVMILDTLEGPASDRLVNYIETLAASKVRVIFVTARPEKGKNSAESVLISKLKVRSGFPVIVVSYNGARIRLHNSHAENPKALPGVEDLPGFPRKTIETFQKINAAMKSKFGFKARLEEFAMPDASNPHIYGGELPKGVDAAAFQKAYNQALKSHHLNYKIDVAAADGKAYFFTQSTALKLNTARIFNALYSQYPDLKPGQGSPSELKPNQMMIFADSTKAANFLKSLPGKGYHINAAKDGAELENGIGATLGKNALEKISVIKKKIRDYTEWLDRRAKYGSSGASGFHVPSSHARYYRDLGFFRAMVVRETMTRIDHYLRIGQYAEASPDAAQNLLERLWYNPRAMKMLVPADLDASRQTGRWKGLQRGYLEIAKLWLRNYYKRNFKDYPNNVSEQIVGTMMNLARDSENLKIEYVSPYTGRRYAVTTRPDRAHLERDDKGNILVAHVYRTGKEPYETEFEDSVERNILARAMLQAYALKKEDGRWWVNDEPDPRVKVVFHYMTRDLSRIETTSEVESHDSEVTATIEKMLADKEFLAYWDEQETKNKKVSAHAGKTKGRKAR